MVQAIYGIQHQELMPRPSPGPKIFFAGPNVLSQTKRWFPFRKFSFYAGTKNAGVALNAIQFLVWSRIFGLAKNILRSVEGHGISPSIHSMATAKLNKSEKFLTNTTAASKYIQHTLKTQNLHQLKFPHSDQNLLSKSTSICECCELRFTS